MNLAETARICRAIASLKPAQKFDDDTPQFWQLVLTDIRYEDARDAVVNLAKSKGFIGTDDIVAEVRRIRAGRLAASDLILPDVDPDDVHAWLAARRAGVAALADGRIDLPEALEGPQDARVAALLPGAFRRPPQPLTGDYTARPRLRAVEAPKAPTVREVAALERERERQLAALAELDDDGHHRAHPA